MSATSNTVYHVLLENSPGTFNSDWLICAITLLGSFITAAITYYLTKRLKSYELYFDKKTKAYEFYLNTAFEFVTNDQITITNLLKAFYLASLYCTEDSLPDVQSILSAASKFRDKEISAEDFLLIAADTIYLFRKDMKACNKNKF